MEQLSHMRIVYVYQVNFYYKPPGVLPLSVVEPVTNIVKRNKHHTTHAKRTPLQQLFQQTPNAVKVGVA